MTGQNDNLFKIVNFSDKRGNLSVIEFDDNLPFIPKRVFYVTHPKEIRGAHAHRTTSELIFVLSGSMMVSLEDKNGKFCLKLENHNRALLVPVLTWIEIFEFSDDCVYAVLANEAYNDVGYIRDHAQFERLLCE